MVGRDGQARAAAHVAEIPHGVPIRKVELLRALQDLDLPDPRVGDLAKRPFLHGREAPEDDGGNQKPLPDALHTGVLHADPPQGRTALRTLLPAIAAATASLILARGKLSPTSSANGYFIPRPA